ncbi:MAG: hypothetical protein NXI24_21075 [bacterium]|nr:hypothetical protein [bacterium]
MQALNRTLIFVVLLFGLVAAGSLAAQAPGPSPETEPAGETPADPNAAGEAEGADGGADATSDDPTQNKRLIYYGRREKNRIRFTFGFGRGEVLPGVISEASSSWFLNSAIRSSTDSSYQPVLPVAPGGIAKYWSFQTGLEFVHIDRFFISYNWYRIKQGLGNSNSTTVSFFHPANDRFRWSFFEGVRLATYIEDRRNLEFKYLHPAFFRGFKIGGFIAREWYREENDISYGSFQASSGTAPVDPNSTAWSVGGVVPGNYDMKGWNLGLAFRYKIFHWFGMQYKLGIVDRSGSYNQGGLQTLTVSNDLTGAQRLEGLFPFAAGNAKDSGLRHQLEAEFCIYCRFTITVGLLREDFTRDYDSYIGRTFGTIPYFYSEKTAAGLGIGELGGGHELTKQEIYFKFGTDFFF